MVRRTSARATPCRRYTSRCYFFLSIYKYWRSCCHRVVLWQRDREPLRAACLSLSNRNRSASPGLSTATVMVIAMASSFVLAALATLTTLASSTDALITNAPVISRLPPPGLGRHRGRAGVGSRRSGQPLNPPDVVSLLARGDDDGGGGKAGGKRSAYQMSPGDVRSGGIFLAAVLSVFLWTFSVDPEIRRAHICPTSVRTFREWRTAAAAAAVVPHIHNPHRDHHRHLTPHSASSPSSAGCTHASPSPSTAP